MYAKIKNRLRHHYQKLKLKSGLAKPDRVILEPTNRCNLNCPFCLVGQQNTLVNNHGDASHDLLKRGFGYMDEETFNKARISMKDFGIKWVYLHFQGEPFLNKKTVHFAKTLKSNGFNTGVFTNGLSFKKKDIPAIKNADFNLIRYSVDGASEESYQQNRVGGKFADVVNSMKNIVEAHKNTSTRVEWQFIVLRNNEHEVDKAKSIAEEIGIDFFLKGFRETDPELAPLNPEYRATFNKKPCDDIYEQIGIYWNGDVVPCCYDVDGEEVMGSILQSDLKSIWNTDKYKNFRKRVDNFRKAPEQEPDICKTCLRWR